MPADQLHPLSLGDSAKVQVGDPVVAIGNPFGLDRTVTAGIVSALQRQIQAPNGFSISHVIQTDAAINPGNSGGPLIDSSGSVIGINSQIQTGGGNGNVGIGFAVPINTAREVVEEIERARRGRARLHRHQRRQRHAGAGQGAETAGRQRRPGQRSRQGQPGGQGGHRGRRHRSDDRRRSRSTLGGDIITEVDGEPVTSMEDVINVVNGAKPGDEIELTVLRGDDEDKEVTVTLGVRPDSAGSPE